MKIRTKIGAVALMLVVGLFVTALAYGSVLRRTTFRVEEMRCSSCLRVIDAELRKVPGISGMTARFSDEQVIVDHDVEVSAPEIAAIITALGYPATVVASQEITEEVAVRFQRAGFGAGAGCCNPGGTSPVAESWKELRRRFFKNGRGHGAVGEEQP